MLKITDISVYDQRKMHQYRLKKGETMISSFKEWKDAWKHYPTSFEEAYNEWKKSMINSVTAVQQAIVANWYMETSKHNLGCKNATPVHDECCYNIPTPSKQEKDETMDTRTEAQQAKDYLIKSLDQALWIKRAEAETTFNLHGQRPKTIKELREGIANGFLSVPEELDDKASVYYWTDAVVWQDPAKKPDRKGYDEAVKQMTADASDVKDQIVVMGAEKGLEALNAFKAKEFK